MRARFNEGDYSVMGMRDAHLPACLLKMWLRELPDSLIPAFYYNYAINCKDEPQARWQILESLPDVNREVILRLFDALYELSKHSSRTKMDTSNLAMVFSPCLVRCPATDALVVMECLPKEGMFINRLLKDYTYMRKLQDDPQFAESEKARLEARALAQAEAEAKEREELVEDVGVVIDKEDPAIDLTTPPVLEPPPPLPPLDYDENHVGEEYG